MDKSINYSKLDEAVKKALDNYEASYNPVDWAQMETMVDVAPKPISLPKSNSPILLIVLITIGAAFILYMLLKPTETIDTSTQIYKPAVVKKPFKILKPTPVKVQPVAVAKDTVTATKTLNPTTATITATPKVVTTAAEPIKKIMSATESNSKKELKIEEKKIEKTDEEIKKEKAAKREEQLKREKKLKKEAQLKKEKAAKKEVKTEPKTEIKTEPENEVTPLEEENDLNRKKQESKPVVDTASSEKKVNDSNDTKGGKKSRRDNKKSKKEKNSTTNNPVDINKSPTEIVKPVEE